MYKLIRPLLLASGLTTLGACNHLHSIEADDTETARPTSLIGRWQLVSVKGGMVPNPVVPPEELRIAADSTVRVYLAGTLAQQFRLRPTSGNFCTQLDPVQLVRFDEDKNPGITYAYQIKGDELTLDGNICVDGVIRRYRWITDTDK
ncbi:hypothetical protein [Solirubrum puertoriconensis]|uniref:Lipocalin-like domain-containing protein n=1 Tax=Solirubrum puertoriconensis TaxID=1751427 RepID=A0A9X0HP91_SOLP1|nr:hypothetical protein [Solirubrum puertoriconensis]KUG09604.1 hypothetical protein ASU33_18065 [Solirubrum puertoriconensis]